MPASPTFPTPNASPARPHNDGARPLWTSAARAVRSAPIDQDLALVARWDAPGPLLSHAQSPSKSGHILLGTPNVRIDHALTDLSAADLVPSVVGNPPGSVWIGAIAYGAAGCLEPALGATMADTGAPGATWQRVDQPTIIHPDTPGGHASPPGTGGYVLGELVSACPVGGYQRAVERVLNYIRAGDVYQVNLAHALRGALSAGSGATGDAHDGWRAARALAGDLLLSAQPRHGVYLEGRHADGRRWAICSASPERFLRYDRATRTVRTTPMKGTRPIGDDPRALDRSDKDRAELAMIVDLMRNDLGRVCVPGSMRVDAGRRVEPHAGSVWQAVAEVSGTLRDGAGPGELLEATLAPGSITGAPKIRAMQIIDELERRPGAELMPGGRGWYCGAAGWLDDTGMGLNVMIRTATITQRLGPDGRPGPECEVVFPVGAGLVADSDPDAEWRETLLKAEVITRLVRPGSALPKASPP